MTDLALARELVNRLSALGGGKEWLEWLGPLCGGLIAWSSELGWYIPSSLDEVVSLCGSAPPEELDAGLSAYIRECTELSSDLAKVNLLRNILDSCSMGYDFFFPDGLRQYLRRNFDTESDADQDSRRAAWVGKYRK